MAVSIVDRFDLSKETYSLIPEAFGQRKSSGCRQQQESCNVENHEVGTKKKKDRGVGSSIVSQTQQIENQEVTKGL